MAEGWDTPVTALKSVGEHRAALFEKLRIRTVGDLLRHYPRQYEDWSHPRAHRPAAPFGEPCCIRAAVLTAPEERRVRPAWCCTAFWRGTAPPA